MSAELALQAIVLGIVEGVTEFLPVSSTGHLIVVGDLIGFHSEKGKVFEVAIQLAAILAVCWEYRARLAHVAVAWVREPLARRFVANLAIAFLPAAVLGLFFVKAIKAHLFNAPSVAVALIAGAIVIIVVERVRPEPRVRSVDAMTWRDALLVGLAQTLALVPGTSRAGATIIGGMLAGLSRHAATEFSFFLAIPTMFAATAYDVWRHRELFSAQDLPVFAVGFLTSFVAAMVTVRWLLRFISRHDFTAFAWYRIAFGAVVLATAYGGWVDWSA